MSMDLIWFEGFDLLGTAGSIGSDLSLVRGSDTWYAVSAIERTIVRNPGTGAGSLRISGGGGYGTFTNFQMPATSTSFVLGFNLYISGTVASRTFGLFGCLGSSIATIVTDSSGHLCIGEAWTGTPTPYPGGTGVTELALNTWYYVEVQMQISSSVAASSCCLWVNGTLEATVTTGTNTAGAGAYMDAIFFSNDGTNYAYFDDVYVLGGASGAFTGPLGPVRVDFMVPTTDVIAEFAIAGTSPGGPNPHSSVVGCYVPAWGGPYLQCGSGALDEGAKDEYSGWMFPGGFAPSGYNIFAFAPTIAYSAWSGGDESATLLCGLSEVYDANSADSFVYSGGSLYGCLAITVPTTQVNAIASLVCTSLSGSSDSLYMDWLNSVTQYVNVR